MDSSVREEVLTPTLIHQIPLQFPFTVGLYDDFGIWFYNYVLPANSMEQFVPVITYRGISFSLP